MLSKAYTIENDALNSKKYRNKILLNHQMGRLNHVKNINRLVNNAKDNLNKINEIKKTIVKENPEAQKNYKQAQKLMAEKKYDQAYNYFMKASSLVPKNVQYKFSAGSAASRANKLDIAHNRMLDAIKTSTELNGMDHPNNGMIWLEIGNIWVKRNYPENALEFFEKAEKNLSSHHNTPNKNVVLAKAKLGETLVTLKRHNEGNKHLMEALEITKNFTNENDHHFLISSIYKAWHYQKYITQIILKLLTTTTGLLSIEKNKILIRILTLQI